VSTQFLERVLPRHHYTACRLRRYRDHQQRQGTEDVILCVLGGVIAVVRGQLLGGAVLVLIMAPIGYGQHVALGMAIDYARGSD